MKNSSALILALLACSNVAAGESLYTSNGHDIDVISLGSGVATKYASGFTTPRGLAFDGQGNLYVANAGTNQVIKVSASGTETTFANLPVGLALYGLAVSGGELYVTGMDPNGGTAGWVKSFDLGGSLLNTVNVPLAGGIVPDGSGGLYVTYSTSSTAAPYPGGINHIDSLGNVSQFATGLSDPIGLAMASNGDLYTAEFTNPSAPVRICRVTSDGSIASFATGLAVPYGLAFSSTGTLYASDFQNGTISMIDGTGSVSPFVSGLQSPRFLTIGPTPAAVPEPASLLALACGVLPAIMRRRHR